MLTWNWKHNYVFITRFGGIEMRLRSIQIGVFPPHIGEEGYSISSIFEIQK